MEAPDGFYHRLINLSYSLRKIMVDIVVICLILI